MKNIAASLIILVSVSLKAQFVEESQLAGIDHVCHDDLQLSAGVAFFDFNNDGFDDIVMTGTLNRSRVFENRGDGTFDDVTGELNLGRIPNFKATGVIAADFDNDGFTDLYFGTYQGQRSYLFWSESGKKFSEAAERANVADAFFTSSCAVADYNLDGHLDLYVGNYTGIDYLYKNNGDRTFTDQSHILDHGEGVGSALAVAFSDVDADGDMDILLGNEYEQEPQLSNKLFINDYPENSFTEMSELMSWDLRINTMGIATGDYDEDGDLDYYVTDISDNYFFEKKEGLSLEEKAYSLEVANDESTSWGTAFFDFDNDTYLDLFVSNGTIGISDAESQEDKLFSGNDAVIFSDVSAIQGVNSAFRARGMSFGDYNNDGKMDLVVGVVWYDIPELEGSHNLVYRNTNKTGNWIKLKLEGRQSNCDGYGALIKMTSGGRIFIREQTGGGTYMSSNSKTIHFGLGNYTLVDKLEVHWPNGSIDIYENLDVNTTYLAQEKTKIYKYSSQRIELCQEGSITIGENNYTEAGIYSDTIRNSASLDQIIVSKVVMMDDPCVVASVPTNELTSRSLQVYPNPFKESINLQLPAERAVLSKIILHDINGRIVNQVTDWVVDQNVLEIAGLEHIKSGVYFLQVQSDKEVISIKLLKVN